MGAAETDEFDNRFQRLDDGLVPGRAIVLATLLGAASLTSCVNDSGAAPGEEQSVVTALYPLAFVAERVGGEHASVTNLTAAGTDSHDLELGPQQVAELVDADVVLYVAGYQPAVDATVEQNADGVVVEVGNAVSRGNTGDPHFWQDPTKLADVATTVAAGLGEANPRHANAYHENAAALVDELEQLDKAFATTLADCDRRAFVTSHAAFGHLADRYNLEMISISGLNPEAEPSPERLSELDTLVRERGITTIFAERLASGALAQTLADEVGVAVAVLDPVEGLADATADEDYFSLMRSNLRALARANGCT